MCGKEFLKPEENPLPIKDTYIKKKIIIITKPKNGLFTNFIK